jgi:hypothetical protein
MSEPDGGDGLDLREQIARIDSLLASTQKMLREHDNIEIDTQRRRAELDILAADRQREDREHLARVDKLIADAQKTRLEYENIVADTRKKQRDYAVLPWQVVATVFGGAAAFFAAGAAFVKLVGG